MLGDQEVENDLVSGERLAGLVVAADGRGDLGSRGVGHLADEQDVVDGPQQRFVVQARRAWLVASSRSLNVAPMSELPQRR